MSITIIILLSMSIGALVGLATACLCVPSSVEDAWHEGYREATRDQAEGRGALDEPAITRRRAMARRKTQDTRP